MEYFLKCTFLFLAIDIVISKDLHVKEDSNMKQDNTKDYTIDLINLYENNEIFTKNERFVRHVETVTESILEHLLKEIKSKYRDNKTKNVRERRMMHNLKNELKKRMHSKSRSRHHVHKKNTMKTSQTGY